MKSVTKRTTDLAGKAKQGVIDFAGNLSDPLRMKDKGNDLIEYRKYLSERVCIYMLFFGAFLGAFIVVMTGYDFSYDAQPAGCVTPTWNRTAAYAQNYVSYPANNATSTCGNYMCVDILENVVFTNLAGYIIATFVLGWVMYGAGAGYMLYLWNQADGVGNGDYNTITEARKYDLLTTIVTNICAPLLCIPLIYYLGENTVFVSYVFPLAMFLSLFVYTLADVQEYDHAMYVVRVMFHYKNDTAFVGDGETQYLVDEAEQYKKHDKVEAFKEDPKAINRHQLYRWMYLCVKFLVPLLCFGLLISAISVSFTHDVNWNTSTAKASYDASIACFYSLFSLNMVYHILKTVMGVFASVDGMTSWLIKLMTFVWQVASVALLITWGINLMYIQRNACKFYHS